MLWGVQIITSAVAFNPIGWSQLAALDKASGYDSHVVYPHEPKLYGAMGQLFKHKKASGSVRFANRNNFLEIEVCLPCCSAVSCCCFAHLCKTFLERSHLSCNILLLFVSL